MPPMLCIERGRGKDVRFGVPMRKPEIEVSGWTNFAEVWAESELRQVRPKRVVGCYLNEMILEV